MKALQIATKRPLETLATPSAPPKDNARTRTRDRAGVSQLFAVDGYVSPKPKGSTRNSAPTRLPARFDFGAVLESHGLNPRSLRFAFERDERAHGRLTIQMFYKGDLVGGIACGRPPSRASRTASRKEQLITEGIAIAGAFKGQGLGAVLYLAAAQLAYDACGLQLQETWKPSREAKAFWRRAHENGWTDEHERPLDGITLVFHRFKKSLLEAGLFRNVAQLVEKNRRSEGPTAELDFWDLQNS